MRVTISRGCAMPVWQNWAVPERQGRRAAESAGSVALVAKVVRMSTGP
ncbi:hypothetical protein SAMN04488238_104244 [Roseicitreum antarcticum]|uniref:Uncharacterized protein n=1 Tax=Roseicitreum antarcticum TaxID=564137 RepID=A0A1H2XLG7_9RHOB|nr:hypothetical protein SAMN04488238_104244 [Roseicitreum antarcticum]